MSFDGLLVDHAGLDLAGHDLGRAVAALGARLDRLEHELAPLRSDWSGQAQQAYLVAQARWRAAMDQLRGVLAESAVAVARSNADYLAADRRGAAAFGG